VTLNQAGQEAVAKFDELSDADKKAASTSIREGNPGLFPKTDTGKVLLWVSLLVVVGLISTLSIVYGVVLASAGKDATVLFAVPAAAIAGLVGLFAKSPAA
jgi:hypothetical protein